MTQLKRPPQIANILKTIDEEYPVEMKTLLEAYMTELEAKQPERPAQIADILNTLEEDHPATMGNFLETYLSILEARQQPKHIDASKDPTELYWRGVRREQQRRARALNRKNNFQ